MDVRTRLTQFVQGLPVAHRVGILTAGVVLLLLSVLFARWVTTPSYSVLYSGLAEKQVATAIDNLESLGVPYQLEGAGSTIMVPRDDLYTTRASLAEAGIASAPEPEGYELLDEQGLSISDFRQQVDFRRAMEGELVRTLQAMDGISKATVHLVTPEDKVFTEQQEPATASVLVTTARELDATEVEAITFLVASAVEGLTPEQITVADADGAVLHAPGDSAGTTQLASRQLRQTREFEQALSTDVTNLLQRVTGSQSSVVVRANLDFDESQTETEVYDPESAVALREQTTTEQYTGTGAEGAGGAVGIDGGPLPGAGADGNYERTDESREFGVDRTTSTTVSAPGEVEELSVAIVMDDGTRSGTVVPEIAEVERLVTAALGLEPDRGDEIAVSMVPFETPEDTEEPVADGGFADQLPTYGGVLVLLLVAGALFMMTRQRVTVESVERMHPPLLPPEEASADRAAALDGDAWVTPEPQPDPLRDDVIQLVQGQPEEIAGLLRGWLGDRRDAS